ncbi:MAG: hypothetical protein ACRDH9_01810 [Actinomycetota bacterium]
MGVSKARDTSRGGSKEPTGRDYAIYYGLGAAGVLLLGALAAVLDWSRFGFRLSVFAWVAVYVPLGVIVLRGRRAKPEAARP